MKSLRLTAWLLSGCFTLAGTACHSSDPEPEKLTASSIKVRYAQTQCADRWSPGRGLSPAQLETTATTYLAQQGITFSNAHAAQSSPAAVCNACTCPTGVLLEGEVSAAQLAAIQALGFTKI